MPQNFSCLPVNHHRHWVLGFAALRFVFCSALFCTKEGVCVCFRERAWPTAARFVMYTGVSVRDVYGAAVG